MLSLLLALLIVPCDGQKNLPPAIPFESVTDDSDGLWITVRITLNTSEDLLYGKTFYGCNSDDEISRSVCFNRIIDLDERVSHVVTGRLRVIHHGPGFLDDEVFPGFTEYRLERAAIVRDND